MEQNKRPTVGIGIITIRNGKVLMGKRRGAKGNSPGRWQFPGGHVEFGETFEEAARREVLEESGLVLSSIKQGPTINAIFLEDNRHAVIIFMIAESDSGEPQNLEPDKCESWQWFDPKDLPSPLFLPVGNLLKSGFDLVGLVSGR